MTPRESAAGAFRFFVRPGTHALTESLFLRLLGLVYVAAFASLLLQVTPLFGSHGIVPIAQTLANARAEMDAGAYPAFPTLFWFGAPDRALVWCCIAGGLSGILLLSGVAIRVMVPVAWLLYLSFVTVGAPFTNFQWDALLLEAGFLAFFAGAPWLVWAYRFLLFRLMFESGIAKLISADPNWRGLHALRFHFLTQPLPTPLAWYAFRLPGFLLDGLTAIALALELGAPFLLFAPRQWRYLGVAGLMLLQLAILLTGNYGFFNLLTLSLCLWAFDDRTFRPLAGWLHARDSPLWFRAVANLALIGLLLLSGSESLEMIPPFERLRPFYSVQKALAPFEIVNTYGLFAVMTTTRPEIVLQGSNDGEHWLDYELPYKPGKLHRGLPTVAPHMPRLDWQLWFAALGTFDENRWVGNLMYRILVGDPGVTRLFLQTPFPKAPRYLRAELYDYNFATLAERAQSGAVWKRQVRGDWFGPVSLTGR